MFIIKLYVVVIGGLYLKTIGETTCETTSKISEAKKFNTLDKAQEDEKKCIDRIYGKNHGRIINSHVGVLDIDIDSLLRKEEIFSLM